MQARRKRMHCRRRNSSHSSRTHYQHTPIMVHADLHIQNPDVRRDRYDAQFPHSHPGPPRLEPTGASQAACRAGRSEESLRRRRNPVRRAHVTTLPGRSMRGDPARVRRPFGSECRFLTPRADMSRPHSVSESTSRLTSTPHTFICISHSCLAGLRRTPSSRFPNQSPAKIGF